MKITRTDKNTGKTEKIFEGKIDKVVVDKSDKNMTVFQDNNLMIFHILPDVDNHDASLESIIESLVRVTKLDYPNLGYTVLHSDGSMSYLIIHKHVEWHSFSYGIIE